MKDVYIDVDKRSMGTFILADTDISELVRSVEVVIEPGMGTRIIIEMNGPIRIDAKDAEIRFVYPDNNEVG